MDAETEGYEISDDDVAKPLASSIGDLSLFDSPKHSQAATNAKEKGRHIPRTPQKSGTH